MVPHCGRADEELCGDVLVSFRQCGKLLSFVNKLFDKVLHGFLTIDIPKKMDQDAEVTSPRRHDDGGDAQPYLSPSLGGNLGVAGGDHVRLQRRRLSETVFLAAQVA